MAQTFFIDGDEEIISVIGHLRKSSDPENYFVFPKRALVLQSAVNLRLFQREAEKQGKHIIIISQDEIGRQLAERVGIPTKDYAAEIGSLRQETHSVTPTSAQTVSELPQTKISSEKRFNPLMPEANHIGSDSFSSDETSSLSTVPKSSFSQQPAARSETLTQEPTKRLKIRDASPQYQTALNSLRDTQPNTMTPLRSGIQQSFPERRQVPVRHPLPGASEPDFSERNQKLQKFFRRDAVPEHRTISSRNAPNTPSDFIKNSHLPQHSSSTASWKPGVYALASLFLLAGAGIAAYFLVPTATVIVTPHDLTRDVEAKYEGRTIAPIGDKNDSVVPVRKIEKTYTTKITAEATGKSSSGNQKSRGTLIISNEYSSDSQPLISTTRFESADGKIFRLAESVTVPGMTIQNGKREAGVVEAVVIADEAGESYNINPTTFTVPGFKGSPKYDKFQAKSTKAFTGGGAGGEGITSITKEDITKSLQKLKEVSKEDFLSSLKQELLPDERVIEDSIEIEEDASPILPLIGSIGTSFDVESSATGKAFVVSEKAIKDKLAEKNPPELQGVSFSVTGATLSFENVVPHYDENTVEFSVKAALMLESVIMKDALREELLGQNEEGIKALLDKHPEIKKIEVNFSPEFLFRSIPNSSRRVTVTLDTHR